MALAVGQLAPDFVLKSHKEETIRLSDYRGKQNVVLAFFPLAWTPVWTAQIPSYQAALDRFDGYQTQVLGLSVDSVPCLAAWAESFGGITYPLLSDFYPHGNVAQCYGVLRSEGYSERAIFVIDKRGIIRYVDVHAIDQQPDNEELFRVLAQIEPLVARAPTVVPAPVSAPAPSSEPGGEVVMYCTSWCPECRRARAFFKEKGIPLLEINISQDRAAAERVRGWANGFETTPTFTVKGQVVVGFDRVKIEKFLRP